MKKETILPIVAFGVFSTVFCTLAKIEKTGIKLSAQAGAF